MIRLRFATKSYVMVKKKKSPINGSATSNRSQMLRLSRVKEYSNTHTKEHDNTWYYVVTTLDWGRQLMSTNFLFFLLMSSACSWRQQFLVSSTKSLSHPLHNVLTFFGAATLDRFNIWLHNIITQVESRIITNAPQLDRKRVGCVLLLFVLPQRSNSSRDALPCLIVCGWSKLKDILWIHQIPLLWIFSAFVFSGARASKG